MSYRVDIVGSLSFKTPEEYARLQSAIKPEHQDLNAYLQLEYGFTKVGDLNYDLDESYVSYNDQDNELCLLLSDNKIDAELIMEFTGEDRNRWRSVYQNGVSSTENQMYIGDITGKDIVGSLSEIQKKEVTKLLLSDRYALYRSAYMRDGNKTELTTLTNEELIRSLITDDHLRTERLVGYADNEDAAKSWLAEHPAELNIHERCRNDYDCFIILHCLRAVPIRQDDPSIIIMDDPHFDRSRPELFPPTETIIKNW